ncbi:MAG: nitrate reductase cytochrome c-type subunit [Rhodocyclaceae bacterium]|nr:nitrate reductase cytochrome c-type subunit [Rhodocyclaceae bacterium]
MKTTRLLSVLLIASLSFASLAGHAMSDKAPSVQSLRGADVSSSDAESDAFRNQKDRAPIPRDFVQQPPLIPHTVNNYQITMKFNKCLDCHSWSRYKEAGATKVSLTHFKDREGTEHTNISPRRYFCMQCHVPQTDAKPLVANTFKPAQGVR